MNYIIFGGSGFIGTHLIKMLKQEVITKQDKIYNLGIVMPGEEGIVPGAAEELKTEDTLRTPNTQYGLSKLVADNVHTIW